MTHVGFTDRTDLIFSMSHLLLREKQQPLSFCLAAGTLKSIKIPLGVLGSAFSPAAAD